MTSADVSMAMDGDAELSELALDRRSSPAVLGPRGVARGGGGESNGRRGEPYGRRSRRRRPIHGGGNLRGRTARRRRLWRPRGAPAADLRREGRGSDAGGPRGRRSVRGEAERPRGVSAAAASFGRRERGRGRGSVRTVSQKSPRIFEELH